MYGNRAAGVSGRGSDARICGESSSDRDLRAFRGQESACRSGDIVAADHGSSGVSEGGSGQRMRWRDDFAALRVSRGLAGNEIAFGGGDARDETAVHALQQSSVVRDGFFAGANRRTGE